ncbi:uncharacterized protein LOC136028401 [Artemia franciscana]|uniref:MARVEL domain-containing protein n=1 Tax=Artemia franciscana TaxID=6661 RepID=A0AA88HM72_ARTSF|nr:hypothetical protein QYM36_014004 [Artemia franciscana]
MSAHQVTVTRTTTSVHTTSAILLNIGYFKTIPGILKVLQLAISIIVVGILGNYIWTTASSRYTAYQVFVTELYLLLIATTALIATFCLTLSCLVSIATGTIIAKTIFEVIYHFTITLLYTAGGLAYIVLINDNKGTVYNKDTKMAAAVLALINGLLYALSTFYAWRAYKRG